MESKQKIIFEEIYRDVKKIKADNRWSFEITNFVFPLLTADYNVHQFNNKDR